MKLPRPVVCYHGTRPRGGWLRPWLKLIGVALMVVLLDITPGHAAETITLPAPRLASGHALEAILHARRSVREFGTTPLTLAEVGQLLWAAQGLTHDGRRTAPSAGALYPLVLYLVAGRVSGLDAGVYRYLPASHQLTLVLAGEVRAALAQAALGQGCVDQAAATLAFAAVPRRTTRQYGERGLRYVHIEVGHAAQNVFLQATALTLATVTVGAFDDAAVARVLKLPREETPLYLMPVGRS